MNISPDVLKEMKQMEQNIRNFRKEFQNAHQKSEGPPIPNFNLSKSFSYLVTISGKRLDKDIEKALNYFILYDNVYHLSELLQNPYQNIQDSSQINFEDPSNDQTFQDYVSKIISSNFQDSKEQDDEEENDS